MSLFGIRNEQLEIANAYDEESITPKRCSKGESVGDGSSYSTDASLRVALPFARKELETITFCCSALSVRPTETGSSGFSTSCF